MYKINAIEREAIEQPWEFEFDGEVYTLPPDLDMRVAAVLSSGNLEGGLRLLMGEAQWERLLASPKIFRWTELVDMLGAYGEDIGVSLGESLASSNSSSNTATRSKPTSSATTRSRSATSTRRRAG